MVSANARDPVGDLADRGAALQAPPTQAVSGAPGPLPDDAAPTEPVAVSPASGSPPWRTGQLLLDRYELMRSVGRGGMGVVWQAFDHELDREVALKLVPPEVAGARSARERLRREAVAAIALSHPNIVKLYQFHSAGDLAFLEMEYVDGPSLASVLFERGEVGENDVRAWLGNVCAGLAEAHRQGVIHLDIKPANLLLAPSGDVKVADFGLARILANTLSKSTGHMVAGTIPYMAPEQLRGQRCDGRTDLYAIGITAYELLTGHPPFRDGDIQHQHLHEAPLPIPAQAPTLWPIVARLLAKAPADRFPDVQALAAVLGATVPPAEVPLAVLLTNVQHTPGAPDDTDDARTRDLMREHDHLVREHAARGGGQTVKHTGDGLLVAFERPEPAVTVAIAIQKAWAARDTGDGTGDGAVRIGVTFGPVLREQGDLYGRTVQLASRITGRARPGEILVSQAVRHLVGAPRAAHFVNRGIYHLEEFPAGERLFEAVWTAQTAATARRAAPPPVPGQRSPFVGRELELRELERSLGQAEQGRGNVVVLLGEPGAGKTRLAEEFLQLVRPRRLVTTTARCFEHLTPPWQPVFEAVEQVVAAGGAAVPPTLEAQLAGICAAAPALHARLGLPVPRATVGDPEEERVRLIGALVELFLVWARRTPLLFFVDDLQWADTSTLDFLHALGRRLAPELQRAPAPLLVLATCREAELSVRHPVNDLFAELERGRLLARVPVRGLPVHDVQALLRDLHGANPGDALSAFVFHRSQGNPYFVEEIYRDLDERALVQPGQPVTSALQVSDEWPVAKRVKSVIEQRLSRLSDACREVLRVAALVGMRFPFEVLAAATLLPEPELVELLEEALAARLVRESTEAGPLYYTFEHGLAAEVLADTGSQARRRRTHVRIAAALEAVGDGGAEDRATQLAHHLMRAGTFAPAAQVYRYTREAGEHALTVFHFEDAVRYLQAAREAAGRLESWPALDRAHLQQLLVAALGRSGAVEEARALADDTIAALDAAGETDAADRTRLEIARVLKLHARQAAALPYLESLRAQVEARPTALYGIALAEYAFALDYAGQSDHMQGTAEQLSRLARRLHHPELAYRALLVEWQWHLNHTADLGKIRSLNRRCVANAQRRQDQWDTCVAQNNLAFSYFLLGQIREASTVLDEALHGATLTGTVARVINARAVRAMCCCFRGEWDRVDEEWAQLTPYLDRVPGAVRLGLLIWARVRTDAWLGRPSLPTPSPRRIYADMSATQAAVAASNALRLGEAGSPQAEERLREAGEAVPASGVGLMWFIAAQGLTAGWAHMRRADMAARWYTSLRAYRPSLYFGSTALELGRVAVLNEWWEDGLAHLNGSIRHCRREGLRPLLAIGLYEKARLRIARGRRDDRRAAQAAMDEAAAVFASLEMHAYGERLEELQRE